LTCGADFIQKFFGIFKVIKIHEKFTNFQTFLKFMKLRFSIYYTNVIQKLNNG